MKKIFLILLLSTTSISSSAGWFDFWKNSEPSNTQIKEKVIEPHEDKIKEKVIEPNKGKQFKLLDYYNGIKASELPCRLTLIENWLGDEYMCAFRNSDTDVFQFHSNPLSKEVSKIFRYMLLNTSDAPQVIQQLKKNYGEPKASFLDKDFKTPLPYMVWGDSVLDITPWSWKDSRSNVITEYNVFITNSKKGGVGLSSRFLKCSGSGQCSQFFGVETNTPNLVVLRLMIFDVDRSNFSQTVISTGKAPVPIK